MQSTSSESAERRPSITELAPVGTATRARTSDRVYDNLLGAIRTLALVPGQSLSETDLAVQLHVSRTPLREAIARLVENGLVTVVPQVGTRVALISLAEVVQAQFVRETLEVGAFEAASRRKDLETGLLHGILDQQRQAWAEHDFDTFFTLDEALHQTIFDLSGYPGAWQAVQRMKTQLDRLRRLMPDHETVGELIAEHEVIVTALDARQRGAGRRAICTHTRRVLQYAPTLRERFPDYFAD